MALPIHIAAVQYSSDSNVRAINRDKAMHLLDDAAHTADLVLMPESSFTGDTQGEGIKEIAEPAFGPTTAIVSQIAITRNAHICYSMIERDGDNYYSTSVLVAADGGMLGKQRKINLSEAELLAGLTPGDSLKTFDTHVGRLGILQCQDAEDMNYVRTLGNQGAQIILVPCLIHTAIDEDPSSLIGSWGKALKDAAVSGKCHVVWANKIGVTDEFKYIGSSMIIDWEGNIIAQGSMDQEEFVRAEANLIDKGYRRSEFEAA